MQANQMRARFLLLKDAGRLANRTFNDREINEFLNKAQEEFTKERYAAWKNRPQIGYGQHPVRNAELAGLVTASQTITRDEFIIGTSNNGALMGPDLDDGNVSQEEDRYGVFVGIPNEVLYILNESCDAIKGNTEKRNVPTREVNMQGYTDGIYDPYAKPYANLVWTMDWGAFTTSEPNGSGAYNNSEKEFSKTGSGYNMTGLNNTDATVEINTDRARYLIPGKDYKVTKYLVHYIKMPDPIVIDVQTPSLQVHCELPNFTHDEIVSKAVKIASASVIPDPNQYQVNQVESKEDE